ncbi:hypothetical protein [Phaeobacter inhibens]|uniref:hypothetical protein n=1 Tax=Phaeobacter inhibens TaxID=221822 RepID=UPI0021A6F713|nr:hypothetical protein [Phaeobacter inhibens]UWR59571.1 hypothetical protein K4F88_11585 [Phaeobacter inhibens]UWR91293.1 hypothetical protein K4K96_11280 [Phaeobacter inhibens]
MGTSDITKERDFEFFQKAKHYKNVLQIQQSDLPDWRSDLPNLAFACDCAFSTVVSVFERSENICLLQIDEGLHRRAAVAASMFQNLALVETAIANAQYVGASTLIRQELEGLDVLRGILDGKQIDSKNPRIKALRNLGLGKIYGFLSGIAHLTSHDGLSHLTGGRPYRYDTQYNRKFCELLVNCHVLAMAGLATIVAFDHRNLSQEHLTDLEKHHSAFAFSVLSENGFMKLVTTST